MALGYPVYTFFFRLLLPFIVLRLFIKSIREPAYRMHLAERFGQVKAHGEHPVWLHAVSVGELQAAFDLMHYYHNQGHPLLITTTTGAGRITADKLYGNMATVSYLPYDDPTFVHSFLKGYLPKIALIMETELWPNLIRAAKRLSIPVWIINGRLSPKSVKRYQIITKTTKKMLNDLSGIIVQSETDYQRYKAIGAVDSIFISGNLKFDRKPDVRLIELGQQWKKQMGNHPWVVFASTREGEEALILQIIRPLIDQQIHILIVPRHPARFDEVARLIEKQGFCCQRRSINTFTDNTPNSIWLGDSLGEMTAYYSLADVAIIGGSWLAFGGQNPIEAMMVHKPVIIGPSTEHFFDVVSQANNIGAIFQMDDLADAIKKILELLKNAETYQEAVDAGQVFLKMHQGALQKTIDYLAIPAPVHTDTEI